MHGSPRATWFLEGNLFSPDVVTDALAIVLGYNRYLDLGGRTALATVLMTAGNATTDVDSLVTQSTRGVGDLTLQLTVNVAGGPAMNLTRFAEYEPGTQLSFLLAVTAPTGNYDPDRLLNMGENRWAFRAGLPFVQPLGSMAPGKATTLEILPSAWFFGSNTDFAGGLTLEQAPLFLAEAHLTHDLTDGLFLSLDSWLQLGGETTLDGVKQEDAQEAGFLGITVGYMLNEAVQFNFRYAASLKPQPERDIDMDLLQLNFNYVW